MITRKHYKPIFSFFMAFFMSCIMSLVISIFNVGLVDNIISLWFKAWGVAFVIALPTIFIVSPIVYNLVEFVIEPEKE